MQQLACSQMSLGGNGGQGRASAGPAPPGAWQGMLCAGQGTGRARHQAVAQPEGGQWAQEPLRLPAFCCSRLHPTLHADTRLLAPQHGAVMGIWGEGPIFSAVRAQGGQGYQGCCWHPTSRCCPGVPPLIPLPRALLSAAVNSPFISWVGTNGAVRCDQPRDMTGCGSRGPSNRAALSVRAA